MRLETPCEVRREANKDISAAWFIGKADELFDQLWRTHAESMVITSYDVGLDWYLCGQCGQWKRKPGHDPLSPCDACKNSTHK